jgi:hypothetical protein
VPQPQETLPTSEAASYGPTLYPLSRVPVLAAKEDPSFPSARVFGEIRTAATLGNEERPLWFMLSDASKDSDLAKGKMRYFETLCIQFDALTARLQRAQRHPAMKNRGDEHVEALVENIRQIQRQIKDEQDPVLCDMICQSLSAPLVKLAEAVSSLEENVLRENFEAARWQHTWVS